jgi:acyl-CoA reductase-like NAD-dependent aldehyde dehydrogenase
MQFEKVQGIVEEAKGSGATIVTGGKVMDGAGKGYFYEPTIISDVKEGVRIVDEEQFGPVLPIIKYSTDEEALARANDSDLGLGGSVWSKDIATANAMANQIDSGTVWVRAASATPQFLFHCSRSVSACLSVCVCVLTDCACLPCVCLRAQVNQHLTMTGAPFGGFKSSGLGRELGKADVQAFTEPQTLMLAKSDKVPSAKL